MWGPASSAGVAAGACLDAPPGRRQCVAPLAPLVHRLPRLTGAAAAGCPPAQCPAEAAGPGYLEAAKRAGRRGWGQRALAAHAVSAHLSPPACSEAQGGRPRQDRRHALLFPRGPAQAVEPHAATPSPAQLSSALQSSSISTWPGCFSFTLLLYSRSYAVDRGSLSSQVAQSWMSAGSGLPA